MQCNACVCKRQFYAFAGARNQIGLAYLDGFGTVRSDIEAMGWIRMAAEWGSLRGQLDYLPMASGLRLVQRISAPQASLAQAMVWTAKAVVENGNDTAAAYLAREAKPICNNSVKKHRQALNDRRWAECEKCTGLTKRELFDGSGLTTLSAYFDETDMPHIFGAGNGWSILHYAVLSGSQSAAKFLVETLNAEVRILSWHSETPLDIAIASDNEQIMDYLITRHANCRPHFSPGSCPLQNISLLRPGLIPETIYRILSMNNPVGIDVLSASIGRTPLINVMLNSLWRYLTIPSPKTLQLAHCFHSELIL